MRAMELAEIPAPRQHTRRRGQRRAQLRRPRRRRRIRINDAKDTRPVPHGQGAGICKSFGALAALDDVTLAVETGSILALLGPNGAGKTTLVRILATLIRPDAGAATIAGHDLLTDPAGVKRSISLTGQYAAIDDKLTGQENLDMMARLWHVPRRAAKTRAGELLAAFDLFAARDRRAATYSGGMRRRLDLAISMVQRPRLLFLDEPTTGLDPRSREQLWATIRGQAGEGVEAANCFSIVLMFIPYVSTAFVPARTMPGALRDFAGHQPFTPIIETMRGLWMGHTSTGAAVAHEAWLAVAYCIAILVVSFAAASWLFRHRTAA